MTSTTSSLYYTLTRQRVIFCQHRRAKSLLNTRLYCGNNADNDGHEANEKNQRNSFQSFGGKNNNSLLVQTLLGSVTNRATRTISNIPDSKSAYASSGKMEKDVKDDDNHNGGDENNISQKDYVENLLESVTNRASQILESSQVDDSDDNNNNAIINEAIDTTSTICEQDTNRNVLKRSTSNGSQSQTKPKHEDKRSYLGNPSVTPTALAHSLWSQVVNPYIDTVIDATCGNGKDTLVLANILFPSLNETHINPTDSESSSKTPKPQLIGIDIQKQACENTIQLLNQNLTQKIMKNNVKIIHASHAPLPELNSDTNTNTDAKSSISLVVYNLGYLPGSENKHTTTEMITSIYSIADAALLLRVGGLLSVMAYPGSSYMEYNAVKYFMEGLAMFSSKTDWRDFVDTLPNDDELLAKKRIKYGDRYEEKREEVKDQDKSSNKKSQSQASVRELVKIALERVANAHGNAQTKQTWRVFDHRSLGRPMSPILFTAMRIK